MGRKVHHKIIWVTQCAESREELSTNSDSKPNGKVLRWLPRVFTNTLAIARVRKGNLVNLSFSFPCRDLPVWILLKEG